MTLVETRTPEITKEDVDLLLELIDRYLDSDHKRITYQVYLKLL